MKIKLHNFKVHSDLTIDFPTGKISYIDGDNGVGKSTIFEAILWVLYKKVGDVANWRAITEQVYVLIQMDDGVLIYRQKKPKYLTVTLADGTQINNSVAQEYINSVYGHHETWLSTSYLKQGPYHPLLEFDPSNRMKLLNQVAFDGDNPTEKINKISAAIRETETELTIANGAAYNAEKLYENICNKQYVDPSWILSPEILAQYKEELFSYNRDFPAKQSYYANQSTLAGKFSAYETMMEEQTRTLKQYPLVQELAAKRDALEKDYEIYEDNESIRAKHKILSNKLSTLTSTIEKENIHPDFTEVEIFSLTSQWKNYHANVTKAGNLKTEYSTKGISDKIHHLERLRDNQWMFSSVAQIANLNARMKYLTENRIPKPETENAKERIVEIEKSYLIEETKIQSEIRESKIQYSVNIEAFNQKSSDELKQTCESIDEKMKREKTEISQKHQVDIQNFEEKYKTVVSKLTEISTSQHIHACPHCSKSIRIVNGKLETSETAPFDKELYLSLSNEKLAIEREIASLKNSLSVRIYQIESVGNVLLQKSRNEIIEKSEKERQQIIAKHNAMIYTLGEKLRNEKSSFDSEKQRLQKSVQDYDTYMRQTAEYDKLSQELSNITEVVIPDDIRQLSPYELTALNNQIVNVKQLEIIEKPNITVEEATKSAKWHQAKREIETIQKEIEKYVVRQVRKVDKSEIQTVRDQIAKVLNLEKSLRDVVSTLKSLGEKPDIALIKKEIEDMRQRISWLDTQIKQSEYTSFVKQNYDFMVAKKNEAAVLNKKYVNLQEMRKIAIETQADVHYHLLQSVNNFMAAVTPVLFENPISVSINTMKQDGKGCDVQCINLSIEYRGNKSVKLKSLSGGEKRQISTLLSLAFSGIFGSGIMILDESMACLSPNKRDAMIKVIRETLSDRTVLVTCHGMPRGIFDNVVSLSY